MRNLLRLLLHLPYSNPENLFTAQFIGNPTMNLFPCRRLEGLIDMPPGAETVGFRPSKVRLLKAGEEIREGDLVTGGPIPVSYTHLAWCFGQEGQRGSIVCRFR